jgi:hypothetical protein
MDKEFYENPGHFYALSAISLFFTLLAMLSLFGLVQREMKELQTFKVFAGEAPRL